MNLTNLFNIKYLMQNIKKSKGLIILSLVLVPMFTSIILLSASNDYALSFAEVSIVNIICMYIIPIVLSMSLFSYVYKKNSVDFIGSMPVSRKSIFITNTIGGIGIIVLMQLLTMISTLLLSKILSNIIIFSSMVWDIFVFYTIAYIFVFTVSNLAMSFSGNKFSQLVAICLILFLIPFLMMSGNVFGDKYSYVNVTESINSSLNKNTEQIIIDEPFHFTAPSYIFDMIINGEDVYEYNSESVIKMLVLSIIYTAIGLILFNKKKLELAGESYENGNTHLIIKMLTFVPFMFVFCSLSNSDRIIVFLFFVAILAVYYFVFDLITNKKIPLKKTVPAFILSWIVVFAVFEGIIPKFGRNNIDIINVDDIQSVQLKAINKRYDSECAFNLLIEDPELINMIVSDSIGIVHNSDYYGATVEVVPLDKEDVYINYNEATSFPDESGSLSLNNKVYFNSSNSLIVLNLKNGKSHEYSRYLDIDVYKAIIQKYGSDKILNVVKNSMPVVEGIALNKNIRAEILDLINKELENITYQDLYQLYNTNNTEYRLRVYSYEDHKLISNNYSYKGFESLFDKVIDICNKHALENINNNHRYHLDNEDVFSSFVKEKNPELYIENIIDEKTYERSVGRVVASMFNYDEIISKFIIDDSKNPIDTSKKMVVISTYIPTYFYTNNIEELYNVLAKAYNEYSNSDIKLNVE